MCFSLCEQTFWNQVGKGKIKHLYFLLYTNYITVKQILDVLFTELFQIVNEKQMTELEYKYFQLQTK